MDRLEALLAELACGEERRAEAAAVQLASLGAKAFPALQEMLHAPDSDLRWWAVRALAEMPTSDEVTRVLVAALNDGADEVCQAAAIALRRHPHLQAIPPLIEALSASDSLLPDLACSALIAIGKAATPTLIDVLETGTQTAKIRAVHALAEIKDYQAIPALMKALEADSVHMQYWAEQGLDKLGLGMVYIKPE